ncbi:LppP/LprE lipoprotein [Curtobacterium sp. UNCCL20]|uniref:LppP/LprE family lipoprotein n=1 Tax=Curtobacterium sp. UNCCL20 TaxID=1502773 RepID=UPI00088AA652|nr:LppP/LprE family lipoprotein [Curtobacterium sp. UNCCL20]SDQ58639.1 LppP/LprE lipoprotein [Curtobacterium sp. UNCCL20]
MRISNTTGGILFAAALAVALTGCSGGTTSSAPTVTETVTASPTRAAGSDATPTPTPTPTPTCGPSDGAAAAAPAIAALPLPSGLESASWDAGSADVSGYDACAPLSWATVTLDHATGSSPVAILLFHQGRYLGTATKEQYAYEPDITRTTPSAIAVTYHYPEQGEPLADPSGRVDATFTWDDAAGRVTMTGDTPPVG